MDAIFLGASDPVAAADHGSAATGELHGVVIPSPPIDHSHHGNGSRVARIRAGKQVLQAGWKSICVLPEVDERPI